MSVGPLDPGVAPARLVAMSVDVRSAILIDPAGGLVSASDGDSERARRLAGLAHEMVSAADSAWSGASDALEAQTLGGAIFAVRDARYTLACVARRLALPALVVYDLRQTMLAIGGSAGGAQPGRPGKERSAIREERSPIGDRASSAPAHRASTPPGSAPGS
ncbi:MAG: hypothetical protein H0U32_12810 [Thermoleophilaceae bacterium]|nr:hypothetical protein [Thermoleophilaceae bacterium]